MRLSFASRTPTITVQPPCSLVRGPPHRKPSRPLRSDIAPRVRRFVAVVQPPRTVQICTGRRSPHGPPVGAQASVKPRNVGRSLHTHQKIAECPQTSRRTVYLAGNLRCNAPPLRLRRSIVVTPTKVRASEE